LLSDGFPRLPHLDKAVTMFDRNVEGWLLVR